ncbi:MAG: methylenetetrahydrofolate reductase, partial [Alphaproteobacteria bacterium]|nr:methylenetetrahydrofolate reductase [Alphaproteobacteria bacterium]
EAAKRAADLLIRQVLDLADQGVEHFHFYALNKATITQDVCRALGGLTQSSIRPT